MNDSNRCLNCDSDVIHDKDIYLIDTLGKHLICPNCGCSFDID